MLCSGAGLNAGSVSWSGKYVAGWVSWKVIVCPLALTPEILCVSMKFLIAEIDVGETFANSAQKVARPWIRLMKSGSPPNLVGVGLQDRFSPSTASAPVTGSGGVVFHIAPERIVTV